MKGVIIGIIVFFLGLMAVVWIAAERANPKMIDRTAASTTRR